MENISKHITYAEAIHSQTAKRKGIDNTPNPTQLENMKRLVNIVKDKLLILMMCMEEDLTLKCLHT